MVLLADLLYVFVAVSLSLWLGDTAFMQIRGPLSPDKFLCLMGGPIDFASGKCCSQAETWNFERCPKRGEEGVVDEKEGKEEHFVIHLEDRMFVLSGILVLETL